MLINPLVRYLLYATYSTYGTEVRETLLLEHLNNNFLLLFLQKIPSRMRSRPIEGGSLREAHYETRSSHKCGFRN